MFPKKISEEESVDVAEVNQRHCLEESGQSLENVDGTHLVHTSGKLVLQKPLILGLLLDEKSFLKVLRIMSNSHTIKSKAIDCLWGKVWPMFRLFRGFSQDYFYLDRFVLGR